jgi:glycosyltransferase involved in cell wall biosynthesis
MKFSIYSSAFNLIKNQFNYEQSIHRFCEFAEEVVICVNISEDNTLEKLKKLQQQFSNLVIIDSHFSYEDPLLDGKVKNAALQATSNEIKIGLDMDEYIPYNQNAIWKKLSASLLEDTVSCYMIPSVNLYKDKNHYFSINPKWYMHKSGLFRGAVNFAKKNDGTVDTNRSDTCELIDSNGNLVDSRITHCDIQYLQDGNFPFVVHEGYIDLDARLLRNKNFWEKHWFIESGGTAPAHKIHKSIDHFDMEYQEHGLMI